jgi:hypothetical protein
MSKLTPSTLSKSKIVSGSKGIGKDIGEISCRMVNARHWSFSLIKINSWKKLNLIKM